jgi:hypothetical protein
MDNSVSFLLVGLAGLITGSVITSLSRRETTSYHREFFLINKKLEAIMTKQEKFDASIERLNTTTNDIAADLTLLKQQAAEGTISDDSLARLDTHIATLEA